MYSPNDIKHDMKLRTITTTIQKAVTLGSHRNYTNNEITTNLGIFCLYVAATCDIRPQVRNQSSYTLVPQNYFVSATHVARNIPICFCRGINKN